MHSLNCLLAASAVVHVSKEDKACKEKFKLSKTQFVRDPLSQEEILIITKNKVMVSGRRTCCCSLI